QELPLQTKFQKARRAPWCDQKTRKILDTGFVHAASRVSRHQVAAIQRMTLLAVAGTGFENIQVVIAFPTAPLTAVGMKLIDRDPARSACTATRAAWAIQMAAGTPETVCQCRRIQM